MKGLIFTERLHCCINHKATVDILISTGIKCDHLECRARKTDFNTSFYLCFFEVSDNYKLYVLLPNLRTYNGKDVTTTANHLRYVYSDNLRTRVGKTTRL